MKYLSHILTFAAGAAVGALVMRYVIKQNNDVESEEVISGEDYYNRRNNTDSDEQDNVDVFVKQNNNFDRTHTNISYRQNESERAKVNYNLSRHNTTNIIPEDDFESEQIMDEAYDEYAAMPKDEPHNPDEPYEITCEEFSESFDHHSKITLYYYTHDDVLCEEDETPIDDIDMVIGYDSLKVFDMATTVWVRNERLGADYEVLRVVGSYEDMMIKANGPDTTSIKKRYNQNDSD